MADSPVCLQHTYVTATGKSLVSGQKSYLAWQSPTFCALLLSQHGHFSQLHFNGFMASVYKCTLHGCLIFVFRLSSMDDVDMVQQ